jgi:hypothetical protein
MMLLEVLVALGVITVGLVALVAVAPMGTGAVGEANLKTTATFLALQRLEEMKNHPWTELTDALGGAGLDGTTTVTPWVDEGYGTIVVGAASYPRFRRVTRITDCSRAACGSLAPAPSLATLRQIAVTVFFLPLTGSGQASSSEERASLTTLVARRP